MEYFMCLCLLEKNKPFIFHLFDDSNMIRFFVFIHKEQN